MNFLFLNDLFQSVITRAVCTCVLTRSKQSRQCQTFFGPQTCSLPVHSSVIVKNLKKSGKKAKNTKKYFWCSKLGKSVDNIKQRRNKVFVVSPEYNVLANIPRYFIVLLRVFFSKRLQTSENKYCNKCTAETLDKTRQTIVGKLFFNTAQTRSWKSADLSGIFPLGKSV